MYESDLKLKSGQYITNDDCNKEKENLQQKFKEKEESLKKVFETSYEEQKLVYESKESINIKTAVTEAVKQAKIEVEGQYQDYVQVKDSGEYKFALFLYKILKFKRG